MLLTYRLASPDSYRIKFDGVEVGSVSKRSDLDQREYWHWGVDVMPLMDHGGRPPSGDAWSFEAALEAFKTAFTAWHAEIDPATWQQNMDYMRAGQERWRR